MAALEMARCAIDGQWNFGSAIAHPYVRFCLASHLEKEREKIAALRGLNPCNLHGEDFFNLPEETKWNIVESKRWPAQYKALYGRLIKLEIDRELSARIIQAKHGFIPRESSAASTTCQDGVWAYSTLPDGSTSIEYFAPLDIPDEPKPVLPTLFVLRIE
jgi:hypothetical protein